MEPSAQGRSLHRQTLPPAQVDCKWWKKGYCFRGSDCFFRHDPALAGVDKHGQNHVATSGGKSTIPTATAQEPPKPAPSASSEACGICLEVPATYGLLIHCDHVFCLECIRSWRSSSTGNTAGDDYDPYVPHSKLKKATKSCPLCRTNSEYIIPSSVFPTPPTQKDDASGEASTSPETSKTKDQEQSPSLRPNPEKQRIVDTYLARLQKIPCRYFEESLSAWRAAREQSSSGEPSTDASPSWSSGQSSRPKLRPRCRFGNHCHYAHIHPVTQEPYIFSSNQLSAMKRSRRTGWDSRPRPRWQIDIQPEISFLEEVIMDFEDMSLHEGAHLFYETEFGGFSWETDFSDDDDDADADAYEDDEEFHDYLVPIF